MITRARRRNSKKKRGTPSPVHSSPLLVTKTTEVLQSSDLEDQSTSRNRKITASKDSGTDSTKFGVSTSVGLVKGYNGDLKKNIQMTVDDSDDEVSEKALLLPEKHEIVPEPTSLGFGEMSEFTGVWYRDVSGKDLTRFIVLHMFLIFSMLMVNAYILSNMNMHYYIVLYMLYQGILIVIWKINRKSISGLYIAVNVVDTVTNFGQVMFAVELLLYSYCVITTFASLGIFCIRCVWL